MFIAARSYAKVNLCLAVNAPEPLDAFRPGWHRIASWFHAVDLFDDLYIERSVTGHSRFERSYAADAPRLGAIDWPLEQDLIFRAHAALESASGEALPVNVKITKRIPSGGGLGGGSSNAATMLRALNALFGLGFEPEDLLRLAATLGSDVAFFLDGPLDAPPRPALVTGFGETIQRLNPISAPITLLLSPYGCNTKSVYAMFDALHARNPQPFRNQDIESIVSAALSAGRIDPAHLFNDLTPAAATLEPRLDRLLQSLQSQGRTANLSGSGSTVFSLGHTASPSCPQDMAAFITRLL